MALAYFPLCAAIGANQPDPAAAAAGLGFGAAIASAAVFGE